MSSLDFFFKPRQIAVVGASQSPQKIGFAILNNIIQSGATGQVIPINPKEKEILGLKCYPSIKKVPTETDLAVISVPENLVIPVAQECGESGVKGLIVITAGFKEVGGEGMKRERELLKICRRYGMRMLGPNCVGLMDTHAPVNASFAKGFPKKGNISFISQSGAMLLAILDWSFTAGLGFSRFISLGNKADLDEVDFIEACAADPETKVILLYIEDVSDGEKFVQVCSRVSRVKPVIILKSGTSIAGAQAASSHTGALAGSNRAYDTAFRQSGVLRVGDMDELFDLATTFATQPLPQGDRVAIVTNAGGPAIVATDALERYGLKVARFEKETITALRNNLPAEANIYNPVDILGDSRDERYRFAIETVLKDKNTESVLVLLCYTAVTEPVQTARSILKIKEKYPDKPIHVVYMGGEGLTEGKAILTRGGVPTFTFPEPSVRALKGLVHFAQNRDITPDKAIIEPEGIDQIPVKATLYDVVKDRRVVMLGHETSRIMNAYGIPVCEIYLATSPEEAAAIADRIGYPVVLKISSPRILHKTDVGGVEMGLHTAKEVHRGFERIMRRVERFMPDAPLYGVEVQKMAEDGVEMIIGVSRDLQFGPLIVFGLGGIYVNLFEDVSFRLASALTTTREIKSMIAETKAYTLLRGYRGKKPVDIDALVDVIARVARLSLDFEEITEMDINPIRVYEKGAKALDVKITIDRPGQIEQRGEM